MTTSTTGLIMGIDPGLSGAIAVYDPANKEIVGLHDMPLTPTSKGKSQIDLYKLSSIISVYARETSLALIEEVAARPGNGVTSMFRFGFAAGAAASAVASHSIPLHFVKPAVWKMLSGVTHDKNTSRAKAIATFPKSAECFERKKDDGRAEAALLAVFGQRLLFSEKKLRVGKTK